MGKAIELITVAAQRRIKAAQFPVSHRTTGKREATVAGFVATALTARTEDGRTMGFATIEDASGLAEVSFFPDRIDDYYKICSTSEAVWARGQAGQ